MKVHMFSLDQLQALGGCIDGCIETLLRVVSGCLLPWQCAHLLGEACITGIVFALRTTLWCVSFSGVFSTGNTACVWWRSRNGRFWHEIGIVGPGVPFDCGADDVLHYVKCIVVPQRNDGVQGGAVEMIAPCVLSKSCCQHVMSQVTSGSALYDVQLANGSAARLRLNHDGAEVTMVDRKNNRYLLV